MRKADIANHICEQVAVSKTEAMALVEYALQCMKDVLRKGEAVKIAGFGNFMVRKQRESGRGGILEPVKKLPLPLEKWSPFERVKSSKET